ncbi:hypothetical protein IAQ61_002667 [Plenodomus lingam]|uniref:uncharacterized protein n=1 Tax=Leptosphaeria maculans TaxID=5022 RepID=UPI00332324FF|nr:hypothetical protein IAQ61_002667 [Plenodomus lingam]
MDDLDFLHEIPSDLSHATLKVLLPSGEVCHISDSVDPYRLIDRCPLLFHAFEVGHRGRLQASIDAPSKSAMIALLRYCYTGTPLNHFSEGQESTLLLQAHAYKMAVDFDLHKLQLLVHGNFTCHLEAATYLHDHPVDLLDTIRFIYKCFDNPNLRSQHGIIATLHNYCVSTYISHRLDHNQEFLTLVSEIPSFGQDLCRTNIERGFEDDCASAIICLPPNQTGSPADISVTESDSKDLTNEMICDQPSMLPVSSVIDGVDQALDGQERSHNESDIVVPSTSTLVIRPLIPCPLTKSTPDQDHSLSSDDDGFMMVCRPKQSCSSARDEFFSSPELVPSVPNDIRGATGIDHSSDDGWLLL